jgi:hypothetical protein
MIKTMQAMHQALMFFFFPSKISIIIDRFGKENEQKIAITILF